MILLIDNYDSFTYNIAQAYQTLGYTVSIVRRQEFSMEKVQALAPALVILGPGPGNPEAMGVTAICQQLMSSGLPLLGICLGHQALGECLGGKVSRAARPMHGKTSPLLHNEQGIFKGLPQSFRVARYHSLTLDSDSLPEPLEVIAWTKEGEVMGIRHRWLPFHGLQFHPESIATEYGLVMLANTLS